MSEIFLYDVQYTDILKKIGVFFSLEWFRPYTWIGFFLKSFAQEE